jgi:PAS domain S-box-containing protein
VPHLEALYVESRLFRPGSLNAFALALGLVGLATALRMALGNLVPGVQFITLFPAVIATTLVCGMLAGFLAVAAAGLCAWMFVLPLALPTTLARDQQVYALAFFAAVSLTDVVIVGAMRAAIERTRRSNLTLTTAFEAYPDAILLTDESGRISSVNQRAVDMFGHRRSALLGALVETLLPERFRSRHVGHRAKFMSNPHPRAMGTGLDLFGIRADGTEFPVDVQIGPIIVGDKRLGMATVRDLTEQTALGAALAESRRQQTVLEERQRAAEDLRLWGDAFKWAAIGIAITDPDDGTFRFVNPAYAKMHGRTVDEMIGQHADSVYSPEERNRLAELFRVADRTGLVDFEADHVRKDGTVFPVAKEVASVRDEDGHLLYRVASCRDISALRKTEAALRQAQKMEAIGNVTGGMAHDFNNLLQIVLTNLDLADQAIADQPEARALVGYAQDAAMRGAELTRSLLAFARRQALRPMRVDLNALMTSMHRLLSRVLGEEIEMTLDLAPGLWPVVADISQVEASIANLATNARDAMPRGGRLTIVTGNRHLDADYVALQPSAKIGDYAMIAVSDNGTGMTPQVMAQIFEPFFTTKEPGKGTGLGLSMVFGFASQSGGHVSVYSEPGIGTTFRLFLPRVKDAAAVVAPPAPPMPELGRGETVLVVEDNPALREAVTRQLAALNYRPIAVDGPAAALAVLEAQPIAVLFSDVVMPGGTDGFELAEQVRLRWPATHVLMTSGFPGTYGGQGEDDTARTTRLLGKPYRREDLARAIRETIDS